MPVFYTSGKKKFTAALPVSLSGKITRYYIVIMKKAIASVIVLIFVALGCKIGASNTSTASEPAQNANSAAEAEQTEIAKPTTSPTPQQAANAVCANPAKPCMHHEKYFEDWEISFKMPTKLQRNKPYASEPFYAVILETYESNEDCDGGEFREAVEAERKQVQKKFPKQKVFAAYQCPDMAAIQYDFDGRWDATKNTMLIGEFLAVYAGSTKEEADKLLQQVKVDHPKAMVKQMTASYEMIDQ
jgi:hypothetical protein